MLTPSLSVLMHFLFLYFRFFITYFPFLIKNLVSLSPSPSPSNYTSLCFFTDPRCAEKTKQVRKERRENFSYLLKESKYGSWWWQQVEQFFIHAAVLWIITNFISAITLTSARSFCAHIGTCLAFEFFSSMRWLERNWGYFVGSVTLYCEVVLNWWEVWFIL